MDFSKMLALLKDKKKHLDKKKNRKYLLTEFMNYKTEKKQTTNIFKIN